MDIPSSSFFAIGKSLIAVPTTALVLVPVQVPTTALVPVPIVVSEEIAISDILFDWARSLVEYFGDYAQIA